MSEPVLLLGVKHDLTYLPRAIRVLETRLLTGKRALLELPKEGIGWDTRRIEERTPFFFVLDCYLKAHRAYTFWGDSEELCKRVAAEAVTLIEGVGKRMSGWPRPRKDETDAAYADLDKKLDLLYCRDRDPHFLEQIKEHEPDIVILGDGHMPYLIREHYARRKRPYSYEKNFS